MSALHFLRPEWLWLLLALPPLAWWLRRDAARTGPWPREVDAHLLPHLLAPVRGLRGGGRAWLVSPLLALAIVALAGPSWSRVQQPLWQSRAPLVLALDLSGAMLAGDLPPSRLARARAKLDTLLEQRRDGEVGLLVFHQDAYVVAPLTDDAANVALFLDALSPDIMPEALEATAPSDAAPAIGQAMALLRQAGFSHGDILLLTDHAGGDAIAAATGAAAAGYRVSALGLGTARGASWRHPRGDILQARLDAGSLQALARAGNGGYAPLAADASDLAELGVLVPRDVDPGAGGESGMLAWQDQGYWLLLPLLLLAPLGFRRGSTLAVLLACALLLPWQPAHAADGGWWLREDQQRHARMERGSEAYRAGDFAAAAEAWRGLPDADAAYNLGNALAKQGRYRDAIAAYDEALRRRPGMEDAIANRQAVLAAVQRQRPSGGQSSPSQSGDGEGQGQDKGSGDQGGETDAGDEAAQGEGRSSAGKQNEEAAEAGARPPDAGAQREADAAQRERMQRALQEGAAEGAGSEARAPEAGETTAERERRLANEAWLRRVPDDPGGLLRERFRLERLQREREGR